MARPKETLESRKKQVSMIQSARAKSGITRFMPADKDMQKLLGDLLVKWSQEETSIDIDDFFALREIGPMKFYNACQTNAYLDECLDLALATIGRRMKNKIRESFEYNMKAHTKYDSLSRLERKEKLDADKNKETEFKLKIDRG